MSAPAHLVVGAGAVGVGLGSALLAAGEPVVFAARGDTARALREAGCARGGIFGEVAFAPGAFAVIAGPAELRAPPASVLVATKTFTSREVAASLARSSAIASGDAPIVLAHNGLGSAETFCEHFPPRRIYNARVITGFRRSGPSRVEVTVHAEPILIGSLFGGDPARVAPLARAIALGGIPAETTAEIGSWLWAKLLFNCALNPLGAILGVPYGELGRGEAPRRLMDRVVREIFAVMQAEGASTRWPDADAYLAHFYAELLPSTALHESSMLQDVRAGRPTEIDALCGEVARRGADRSVPAPVNEALAALIRALSQREGG
jgi:2-dehydropantoate 2-reductase